jgi:hypothetical protein
MKKMTNVNLAHVWRAKYTTMRGNAGTVKR